ncbi:MAG TPA: bifunctional diaminohydroxyphosphoribosylaminopyrimidine deaminase/5-amino-6-(5-phosphoribosylamino)uracil reductase RibD, partial [Ignavibacteriaceae bacterium]|nr:bifunctional diaminohydroxyphosphoribosylaminopyrimidine deaminase/5-amino-6-(5-phosphoribosylamino)uracil reductase RibD [Ignavibacteriaceae bacterium]
VADESYIQLTLELAKRGIGKVSPNPLVGCVITKNNKIIGAGFHTKYGDDHAEINAINSVQETLEGSTLYVNLEPCTHYGNTPPCVDRIIKEKIKRVVIGTLDVNPLVNGKSIKKLKDAGIDVKAGLLEKECIELNNFFFKFISKKLPYVTLKAAATLDGKIADVNSNSEWISSSDSRKYVHSLRNKFDAVLIGANTALIDNPQLTVRHIDGRNPWRIILDSKLSLPINLKLFQKNFDKRTFLVISENGLKKKRKLRELEKLGVKIITVKKQVNNKTDLKFLLKELAKLNITSVLVEGGSKIFTSFIKQKLFDDLLVFISPKLIGDGVPVIQNIGINSIKDAINLKLKSCDVIGDDIVAEYVL